MIGQLLLGPLMLQNVKRIFATIASQATQSPMFVEVLAYSLPS